MAVYTHLGAEELAQLIAAYDVGELVSAKGIAEGVSNSNWLVETTQARFILTMYERRIELSDLPFFLGLLDHLSEKGCAVPRTIHDREGAAFRMVGGKAVALIEFLPGVSPGTPTPAQARSIGAALARMHLATQDFRPGRPNDIGQAAWPAMARECGAEGLASIDPDLPALVEGHLASLTGQWPAALPSGVIHADLFPDNTLFRGENVTGMIDFYFACSDALAYDLAVTHAAWCFSADGRSFHQPISEALLAGYESVRPLSGEERSSLPVLARGAAMRFLLSRACDWLDTPDDALVTRKDPLDFARRLEFYDAAGAELFG